MKEAASSNVMTALFTRHSHHENITVMLLVQNYFFKNTQIASNCAYKVIFR